MKLYAILTFLLFSLPFTSFSQCTECPSGSTIITGSTNIMEQNNADDYCIMGTWTGTISQIANNSTVTFCPSAIWEMPGNLTLQQGIVITNYGTITDLDNGYKLFIQGQTDLINESSGSITVTDFENQDTEFTNHGSLIAENIYLHGPSTNTGTIESTADCSGSATTNCGFYIGQKSVDFNNTGTVTAVDVTIKDGVVGGSGTFISTGNLSIESNSSSTDNTFIVNNISFQASSNISGGNFQISGVLDCNNANITTDICFEGSSASSDCQGSPMIPACAVLPVELTHFSVKQVETNLIFNWETEMEINVSHFELEYSFDGIDFKNLTRIASKGDGVYQYLNENLEASISYFRLKSVDFDGHTDYSEIRQIIKTSSIDYSISPNPTRIDRGVEIRFSEKQDVMISLYNYSGQKISSKYYEGQKVVNFDTDKIQISGLYLLKISTNKAFYTEEIFIN
ncbi:T9SS type A sorting domain-containing protein [Saprospiraceae bacterium]|nr:T9SS type A sorting domain-containing protein [Saprospiraceae bacterium]